ncbi:MAG: glycosyltransferase family 4 protein [Rhodothermia bacterium]|nr:MAG: glycosyltransferase family 4 protein [Rhodothermia bacterium]
MRLLLITTDFPPSIGGIQTYAFELAVRLATRSEKFAVVSVQEAGSESVDDHLSFPVYRIRSTSNLFPLRAVPLVASLCRQDGFDVAFCISWPSAVACLLAKLMGGPRIILAAAHGRELLFNPGANVPIIGHLYERFRQFITRRGVDRFYAVSRFTRDVLIDQGVSSSNVIVLNNGTDPTKFFAEAAPRLRSQLGVEHSKIILTVSRLVRRKGIDVMIAALPRVLKHFPEALYVIVGKGPEFARLKRLSYELGVDDSVLMIDQEIPDQLRAYYNACDVFVLPARQNSRDHEGFGIVLLEASACGIPVIGTHSGGIPDAVIDGATGILVPPDSEHELAEAVVQILSNSDLANRLGEAGREHVISTANWDAVSNTLYQSMTARSF